jgi:hypothetical protein
VGTPITGTGSDPQIPDRDPPQWLDAAVQRYAGVASRMFKPQGPATAGLLTQLAEGAAVRMASGATWTRPSVDTLAASRKILLVEPLYVPFRVAWRRWVMYRYTHATLVVEETDGSHRVCMWGAVVAQGSWREVNAAIRPRPTKGTIPDSSDPSASMARSRIN